MRGLGEVMYFRIFLMTKDEARRIAANIAKPGRRTAANLLTRRAGGARRS